MNPVLPFLNFNPHRQLIRLLRQRQHFGKIRVRQAVHKSAGAAVLHLAGQEREGLHGGENGLPLHAMVAQVRRDRKLEGKDLFHTGSGKVCHRRIVFGSTATGRPAALAAQCLVNPVQTRRPASARVTT